MTVNDDNAFSYLNLANEWPGFDLSDPHIVYNSADGSLMLQNVAGAFAFRAVFRSGPVDALTEPGPRYRVQVYADPLAAGAHVQLFTHFGATPPPFDASAAEPFDSTDWRAAPLDALDVLLPNRSEQPLWIGGVFAKRWRCIAGAASDAGRLRP